MKLLLTTLFFCSLSLNAISSSKIEPRFKVELNSEKCLSLPDGKILVRPILYSEVGQFCKIFLIDGTMFWAQIKEYETDGKFCKISGVILDKPNAVFAFHVTEKNLLGCILLKDENKLYSVKYNEILKGFAFELDINTEGKNNLKKLILKK